jgi:hypothetical protein
LELVDGRACGTCTVCCVTPTIDAAEFQKLPGVQCRHLSAGGECSIYETRYSVCRQYYCGWRYLGFLGEHWRPDKSGVLINFEADKGPPDNPGVSFLIVASPSRAFIRELAFRIAHLISGDVAVSLGVAGPPGYYSIAKALNEELREAALSRDYARIETAITDAVAIRRLQPNCFTRAHPREEGTPG